MAGLWNFTAKYLKTPTNTHIQIHKKTQRGKEGKKERGNIERQREKERMKSDLRVR
jgi:hypothetical protein